MNEIRLFVAEGCRPCMMVENLLKKVPNWDKTVRLTDINNNKDFAKYCKVRGTPTLVGLKDGKVVAFLEGPSELTYAFWMNLVRKHGPKE